MSEFFAMGGYAFYVWASYGAAVVVLGLIAWFSWRRVRVSAARLETLRAAAPHRRRRDRSDYGAE